MSRFENDSTLPQERHEPYDHPDGAYHQHSTYINYLMELLLAGNNENIAIYDTSMWPEGED